MSDTLAQTRPFDADQKAYFDPPTAATLAKAENAIREKPVARIPIGAELKMLGGRFKVTNADARRLTLRGPLSKLKLGQIMNIFGVAAQVTLVGRQVATLTARNGSFDIRPILRLEAEPPPAVSGGMGPDFPDGTTAQDLGANTEPTPPDEPETPENPDHDQP